jgi:predicted acetyltransferase
VRLGPLTGDRPDTRGHCSGDGDDHVVRTLPPVPSGLGNADRIEHFWTDERRQRYLVRVDGKLSGFVLTRVGTYFSGDNAQEISEFFILRKYRRQGVGQSVATRLFDGFGGTWEVAVMKTNTPAQHFWRRVIADYTGCRYEGFSAPYGSTDFVIFRFRGAMDGRCRFTNPGIGTGRMLLLATPERGEVISAWHRSHHRRRPHRLPARCRRRGIQHRELEE